MIVGNTRDDGNTRFGEGDVDGETKSDNGGFADDEDTTVVQGSHPSFGRSHSAGNETGERRQRKGDGWEGEQAKIGITETRRDA